MTKMNYCLIARPREEPIRQQIAAGGIQPVSFGPIVLPGDSEWPRFEIELALDHATSMVPGATVVLSPVLALPEQRGQDNIRERIDFRRVKTKYPVDMFATDGAFFPDSGAIFVSLGATTSPNAIITHEIWHYAECCLLTDDEIVSLALAYGAVNRAFSDIGQLVEQDPSEWLACAFVQWSFLHNHSGMVVMHEPLETLFHELASGGMAGRRPRKARQDIGQLYRDIGLAEGVEAIANVLQRNGWTRP